MHWLHFREAHTLCAFEKTTFLAVFSGKNVFAVNSEKGFNNSVAECGLHATQRIAELS
jgi:hypothetical protein